MTSAPTELAVVVAMLESHSWTYADEIRDALAVLGFNVSHQQLTPLLTRMATVDAPWLERRRAGRWWRYRVTQWGVTDVENRLPAIRVQRP